MQTIINLSLSPSIKISRKFHIKPEPDAFKDVTEWLTKGLMVRAELTSLSNSITPNEQFEFLDIWRLLKANIDDVLESGGDIGAELLVFGAFKRTYGDAYEAGDDVYFNHTNAMLSLVKLYKEAQS